MRRAETNLPEQHWPRRIELDPEGDQDEQRRERNEEHGGADEVGDPLEREEDR
jgi:hypothetical protein